MSEILNAFLFGMALGVPIAAVMIWFMARSDAKKSLGELLREHRGCGR